MKISTLTRYCNLPVRAWVAFLLIISVSKNTTAQYRNYETAFSDNFKGDIAIFGNTLMNLVKANGSVDTAAMNGNRSDGNSLFDNGAFGASNMQYTDVDGNTGNGAVTRNSSSADLILPSGVNTIKFARLYWGGRVLSSDFDIHLAANQSIKIRKGSASAYQQQAATRFDKTLRNDTLSGEFYFYQAYTDITTLVKQQGAGTYTVADAVLSKGTGGDYGNYGGWSIVVVYENPLLSFSSIRLYDGFQQIYTGGGTTTTDIELTGLNVPSTPLLATDAQMGIITWEGDARYNGDLLKLNNQLVSNALNPADNIMNGTITRNGVHVSSKTPDFTDQMGIDIDVFNVGTGYGILPNASAGTLQFGTNQDQFFSGVVSFVIKMKDPAIHITKTVSEAGGNKIAETGEVLTYTFKGSNTGSGNANELVLTDTLPANISFLPNSLKVKYCPGITAGYKTDAAGDDIAEYDAATRTVRFRMGNTATGTTGGFLEYNTSFEVEFKTTANKPAAPGTFPIVNKAWLKAFSDGRQPFAENAAAAINLKEPQPINTKIIHIPNAFSPNNDGVNDLWKIPDLADYPQSVTKVFNRYGQVIYHNTGSAVQWDGKFNGVLQPAGSYSYIIDAPNMFKKIAGVLILIR